MNVDGKKFHSIWIEDDIIKIIDQRKLPHQFSIEKLESIESFERAIKDMYVRGAPLIGATAAFGMYVVTKLAKNSPKPELFIENGAKILAKTRPTAIDLLWAIERMKKAIFKHSTIKKRIEYALIEANLIIEEIIDNCSAIGKNGLDIINAISKNKSGKTVNILTHCNAGWLATVDHGTATAPIYAAFDKGIDIHVWVDETRPRNQGARLTAWELQHHGVPHTVIADNTGGHLMQHGMVDMVIVGSDRTTISGDVANKIGTYLKALAAKDNDIPFYVALPESSFDWNIEDGIKEIPIEKRDGREVNYIQGLHMGKVKNVLLTPKESPVANYAFDVTPSRLVTGLITERGICMPNKNSILELYPEKR